MVPQVASHGSQTIADVVGNVESVFLYGISYLTDGTLQDHSNIMNNYLDGQDSSHARNGIDVMASSLETALYSGKCFGAESSGIPINIQLRSVEYLRHLLHYNDEQIEWVAKS